MAQYRIVVDFSEAGICPNPRQVEVATVLGRIYLDHLPADFLRTTDGKSITAVVNAGTKRHSAGFNEVIVNYIALEPPAGSRISNLEQAIGVLRKELPEARVIDGRDDDSKGGYEPGSLVSTIDVRDMGRVVINRPVGTKCIGYCIRSVPTHQLYVPDQGLSGVPVTTISDLVKEGSRKDSVIGRYVILGEKSRYEKGERYCEPSELRWIIRTLDESITAIGIDSTAKPLVTYSKGKLTTLDIFPPRGSAITKLSWSRNARLLKHQQRGMVKYNYGPHLVNIHRTNAYIAANGQRLDIRGMLVLKGRDWSILPADAAQRATIEEMLDEMPVQINSNDGSEAIVVYGNKRILIIPRTGSELEFRVSESALESGAVREKPSAGNSRLKNYSVRDSERNEVYELGLARVTSRILQEIEKDAGVVQGDVFDRFYEAYIQTQMGKK
jgi:hypothetical protein